LDNIYGSGSQLPSSQRSKLNSAFNEFITKYPAYASLYVNMAAKELKFLFRIDASINGNAAYIITDRSIRFKTESSITYENLKEELVHAMQHDEYGDAMTATIRNYEYEAEVFQDLACAFNGGGCPRIGSANQSPDFMSQYTNWIIDCYDTGEFSHNDINTFNNFCSS